MDVDFFYHMVLATWLFLLLNIWLSKRWASISTLGVGLLYEGYDLIFNQAAYSSFKAHKLDSLLDMGAAVLAVGVLLIILKFRDRHYENF